MLDAASSPASSPPPAFVAQGIEHRSPKAGVAGSNPAGGTDLTCTAVRRRSVLALAPIFRAPT